MPKRGRFRKATSDRSGFDCLERELVKDKSSKVTTEERDDPPPSKISLGGEGDVSQGAYFRSSTSLTIEAQVENPTLYLAQPTYTPDTNSALKTNLVSHWRLEEVGGFRYDSFGQNHLQPVSTNGLLPTITDGLIGSANAFRIANSSYLTLSNNALKNLDTGDIDFTISAWVRPTAFAVRSSPGSIAVIASKGGIRSGTPNTLEWRLSIFSATSQSQIQVSPNGTDLYFSRSGIVVPPGVWSMITAFHDSVNNELNVRVNADTGNTVSYGSGVANLGGSFSIGQEEGTEAFPNNLSDTFDGDIDDVRFWRKRITNQEVTDLYNAGNGNSFSGPTISKNIQPYMRVTGSNAAITLSGGDPTITAGREGQILTLFGVGSAVHIHNGVGLSLAGSNHLLLSSGSVVTLLYSTANNAWNETSRVSEYQGIGG